MQKVPFSGITALDPNESIYSDNSAFVDRDRFEIDRELKLGVKTHRHNALSGLSNPVGAPSGLVVGSGGSIPAGLSLTIGITYQDVEGGETLVGPTALVTTPSPVQAPTSQLEATIEYTAGTLDVDTFTYAFTYVDSAGGETPLSPPTVVVRSPGFANAKVKLQGQAPGGEFPDASIVAARVYRARAGGEYVFLAEVSTGVVTDDGSVAPDCDRHPPSFNLNTTGGANQILVTLPSNPAAGSGVVESSLINLYCSQTGTFDESCLVGRYPSGSAGTSILVSSLSLLDAQPPDVNRSFGGASQIDPDTELLDWHWKRPVGSASQLPGSGSVHGDVRVVLNEDTPYEFNVEEEWTPLTGGGRSSWRPPVATKGDLPGTGLPGDVCAVIAETALYFFNEAEKWVKILAPSGEEFEVEPFVLEEKFETLEGGAPFEPVLGEAYELLGPHELSPKIEIEENLYRAVLSTPYFALGEGEQFEMLLEFSIEDPATFLAVGVEEEGESEPLEVFINGNADEFRIILGGEVLDTAFLGPTNWDEEIPSATYMLRVFYDEAGEKITGELLSGVVEGSGEQIAVVESPKEPTKYGKKFRAFFRSYGAAGQEEKTKIKSFVVKGPARV